MSLEIASQEQGPAMFLVFCSFNIIQQYVYHSTWYPANTVVVIVVAVNIHRILI